MKLQKRNKFYKTSLSSKIAGTDLAIKVEKEYKFLCQLRKYLKVMDVAATEDREWHRN